MTNIIEEYIDVPETKKIVKNILSRYKFLSEFTPVRHMPKSTQSFNMTPVGTNRDLNAIEAAADKNIKQEQLIKEKEKLIAAVDAGIDTLEEDERYIVEENMLKIDKVPDVLIYTDLHMSKTVYYRIKKQALVKLAFSLGLEVYK